MDANKPNKTCGKKVSRIEGDAEQRTFEGTLKPVMTEEEKKDAQILELSYDFSCRIIRLYKYLNEGKLNKADRDIIDALGRGEQGHSNENPSKAQSVAGAGRTRCGWLLQDSQLLNGS